MNTAINILIPLVSLIALILSGVLATRARSQFGCVAPMGFLVAFLLGRIGVISISFMSAHLATQVNQEVIRQRVAGLALEDSIFFLSLGGHATGIWSLGAICFLLCGLLDLKAGKDAPAGKLRWALISGGAVLILLSTFYPYVMMKSWL